MTQHPFHVLSGAPNETLPPLVALDVTSISLVLLVLGAYVCGIGQLSYFLKERLYISSALISVAVGIGQSACRFLDNKRPLPSIRRETDRSCHRRHQRSVLVVRISSALSNGPEETNYFEVSRIYNAIDVGILAHLGTLGKMKSPFSS